uniref:Ig-like domain-containing protein n=1 Tax=Parastrongyloides trichosuri TaxID=131310 RepID=A0A0N4Z138_PARTI
MVGFKFTFQESPSNNLTYIIANPVKNIFQDFKKFPILCSIHKCDIGWLFIDNVANFESLYGETSKKHKIQHAVVIVLNTESKKIEFFAVNYDINDIKIALCPYTNWISKHNIIKFYPEENIKDNGFFLEKKNNIHIVVPIYPKVNNEAFFSCGRLIQPSLPDTEVGFRINKVFSSIADKKDIEIFDKHEELVCSNGEDHNAFFHFGLVKSDDSYKKYNEMVKIDGATRYNNTYFSNQIIFIYDKFQLNIKSQYDWNYQHSGNGKIDGYIGGARCVRKLSDKVHLTIIPIFKGLEKMYQNNGDNKITLDSSMISRDYTVKCLGYAGYDDDQQKAFQHFYSKAAKFVVFKNGIPIPENETILIESTSLRNFGKYSCKSASITGAYINSSINLKDTYILPGNGVTIKLGKTIVNRNQNIIPKCIIEYPDIGKLRLIKVDINFNGIREESYDLVNFTKTNEYFERSENEAIIKNLRNGTYVNLTCSYITSANTIFDTNEVFGSSKDYETNLTNIINKFTTSEMNPKSGDNDSIKNLTLILFCLLIFIVLILCLLIVSTLYIMKKRKMAKKKKPSIDISTSASTSANSSTSGISKSSASSISKTGITKKDVSLKGPKKEIIEKKKAPQERRVGNKVVFTAFAK